MANLDNGGNYQKEYQAFIAKLFKFHAENGTPIKRIPMLGGRELDLYHLHCKVKALGGVETVTRCRLWGEVARSYNLPATVTSASYAVRMHYSKYLEKFVEAMETGNFPSSHAPLMPRPVLRPLIPSLSRTPTPTHPSNLHTSHPLQARIPLLRGTPQATHLQRPKAPRDGVDCDRLVRSLQCGLPNEVDFTLNVLTVLSFGDGVPGGVVLRLENHPQLLDVMLAHVAVFPEDDTGLEVMYQQNWHRNSESDFIKFWELTVPDWVCATVISSHSSRAPCHDYERELFGSASTDPSEGGEGYRVGQMLTVLRNCSFLEGSVEYLAGHEGVLRFLLLCVNSSVPDIRGPGLDTVANIASCLLLDHNEPCSTVELLLGSTHHCVLSQDKYAIIRGLEILGELAWCLANEASLSDTPAEVYQQMFRVLLVPDCELVISSLDALYNLSFYGSDIAEDILDVGNSLEVLMCLVTLQVESFGMDELSRIDLFLPSGESPLSSSNLPTTQLPTSSIATGNLGVQSTLPNVSTPRTGPSSMPTVSIPAMPAIFPNLKGMMAGSISLPRLSGLNPPKNMSNTAFLLPTASVPVLHLPANFSPQLIKQMTACPGSVPSITSLNVQPPLMNASLQNLVWSQSLAGSSANVTASSTVSMDLPAPGLPAEEYAQKWLKACYEEAPGQFIPRIDMHTFYVVHCSQVGQTHLLDSLEFSMAIKKVFPNSLATRLIVGSHFVYMIAGIRKRHRLVGIPVLKENVPLLQKATSPINNSALSTDPDLVKAVVENASPQPMLQNVSNTPKMTAVTGLSLTPSLTNKGSFAVHSPLMVTNKAVDTSSLSGSHTPNVVHIFQPPSGATSAAKSHVTYTRATSSSMGGNPITTVSHITAAASHVLSSPNTQGDSAVPSVANMFPAVNQHYFGFSSGTPTNGNGTGESSLVSEASADSVSGLRIQNVYSLASMDQITKEHSYSHDPSALRSRENIAASALLSFTTVPGEDASSVGDGSPSKVSETTNSSLLSVGPPPETLTPAEALVVDIQGESNAEQQLQQDAVSETIVDVESISDFGEPEIVSDSTNVADGTPSVEIASGLSNGELELNTESTSELRLVDVRKQEDMPSDKSSAGVGSSPQGKQRETEDVRTQSPVAEATNSLPPTNVGSENALVNDASDLRGSEPKRMRLDLEGANGSDLVLEQESEERSNSKNGVCGGTHQSSGTAAITSTVITSAHGTESTDTPVTCMSENMSLTCTAAAHLPLSRPVTSREQRTTSPMLSLAKPVSSILEQDTTQAISTKHSVPLAKGAAGLDFSTLGSDGENISKPTLDESESMCTLSPSSNASSSPQSWQQDSGREDVGTQQHVTEVTDVLPSTNASPENCLVDGLRESEPKQVKLVVETASGMEQKTVEVTLSDSRTAGGSHHHSETAATTSTGICEPTSTGVTVTCVAGNTPLTYTAATSRGSHSPVSCGEQSATAPNIAFVPSLNSISSTVASCSGGGTLVEPKSFTSVPSCGDKAVTSEEQRPADPISSAAVSVACSSGTSCPVTVGDMYTLVTAGSNGSTQTSVAGLASDEARVSGAVSPDQDSELKQGTKRMCLWDTCTCVRWSWESLLYHAVYDHLPTVDSFPCLCPWQGCSSKAKRMRPSLIRHLQTYHCSDGPAPSPPCIPFTLAKLKAMSPFEYEVETPLTKAIRLTAALVLRNLAKTTPLARRRLRKFEHILCRVALSTSEASTAVAQCLHYLYASSDS